MEMFCFQCEQTAHGKGCDISGVCGKDPVTAGIQDLLLHVAKGAAFYGHRLGMLGRRDKDLDHALIEALFTTVTNVNFDADRVEQRMRSLVALRDKACSEYETLCRERGIAVEKGGPATLFLPAKDRADLLRQAGRVMLTERKKALGDDIVGLQELCLYGLKGMAAYADHAFVLGHEDDAVYAFFHEALDYLTDQHLTVDGLLGLALKIGAMNMTVMGLLDAANTGAYGHPEPTRVRITPLKGQAILVSGHDLKDLEVLLEQTAGKNINVYTHGEMLPANAYPGLKKFKHLVGNYGGAWQDQKREFAAFPGAILMTTNCIQRPAEEYRGRIFTSGLVAFPGVTHIQGQDFKPVIEAALTAPGFAQDAPEQTITVGFGHEAVMGVAGQVIEAVKQGKIRHFFLIGGCDGAKSGRNYYTALAQAVPKDCVVMTLACGKYRFNKLDFGDIGGIPRLLDVGQCNDAYSAIVIAAALAKAFGTDVNGLPLSMVLSWYEQKAVVILLTLLHLGIRNIRLGPSMPACVTPAALDILHKTFNLMPVTTVESDLHAILG